jgi:hypothetical protein
VHYGGRLRPTCATGSTCHFLLIQSPLHLRLIAIAYIRNPDQAFEHCEESAKTISYYIFSIGGVFGEQRARYHHIIL